MYVSTLTHAHLGARPVGMFAGMGVMGAMIGSGRTAGWVSGGGPAGISLGGPAVSRVMQEPGKAACGAKSTAKGGKDGAEPFNMEGCGCGESGDCDGHSSERAKSTAYKYGYVMPGVVAHGPPVWIFDEPEGAFTSERSRRFDARDSTKSEEQALLFYAGEPGWAGESPLGRASPPEVRGGCEGCEGWQDQSLYCAYDDSADSADLDADDIRMLDRAYEMINDHMHAVEGWFRKHSTASDVCPTTRLSGGDFWYPKSMIYETAVSVSWNATNIYGSRYMLFNRRYLQAFTNTFNDNSGNADVQTCVVLGLARTVVHETLHSCGVTSEVSPTLIAYYFGRVVAKELGLTGITLCCASAALAGGYKESGYASLADVEAEANYEKVAWSGTGRASLTGCS